ncbi:MAG: hypothetical protein AAGG53_03700 [Cyanobacteria bacterium P01_H01_bin.152]
MSDRVVVGAGMKRRSRNRVDELVRELSRWEGRELRELQAALGGLLGALEREAAAQPIKPPASKKGAATDSRGAVQSQRGHIEEKYIQRGKKLHGPYRYLRYWQDGKLRSKYLGKAKVE